MNPLVSLKSGLKFGSHYRLRFDNPIQSRLLSRQEEERGGMVQEFISSDMDFEETGLSVETVGGQRRASSYGTSQSAAQLPAIRGSIWGAASAGTLDVQLVEACGDANGMDVLCHDQFDSQVEAQLNSFTKQLGYQATLEKVRTGFQDEAALISSPAWQEVVEIYAPELSEKGIAKRKLELEAQDKLVLEYLAHPAIPGLRRTQLNEAEADMLQRLYGKSPLDLTALAGILNTLDVNATGYRGATLLHQAALEQCPEAVQFLLEKGANIHAVDLSGRTPLHRTISNFNKFTKSHTPEKHLRVLQLLLDAKAELNAQDEFGMTPLMIAIADYKVPSAKWLIEQGSDVTLPTHAVKEAIPALTPLMMALGLEYDQMPDTAEVVALLKAKNAAVPVESAETLKTWQKAFLRHRAFSRALIV